MKNKCIEENLCAICGKVNETSLNENKINGIIINGEYICRECEMDIVKTRTEEKRYEEYVDKIKVVIYK